MPPRPNTAAIKDRIATLSAMANDDLRALWQEVFGRKVPFHAQKELLVFGIARRIQEEAFGDLPKRLKKRLELLEREPEGKRKPSREIKPGTRLLREWRDDTHEVIVCDRSYTYRGQAYTSYPQRRNRGATMPALARRRLGSLPPSNSAVLRCNHGRIEQRPCCPKA